MTETTRPTTVRVIADHTPGRTAPTATTCGGGCRSSAPPPARWPTCSPATPPTGEACWPTDDLARMVGLAGNRSKLWLSLDRLHRFRVATFVSTDTLTIRLWLPALSDRQLAHLPASMAAAYRPAPDRTA